MTSSLTKRIVAKNGLLWGWGGGGAVRFFVELGGGVLGGGGASTHQQRLTTIPKKEVTCLLDLRPFKWGYRDLKGNPIKSQQTEGGSSIRGGGGSSIGKRSISAAKATAHALLDAVRNFYRMVFSTAPAKGG